MRLIVFSEEYVKVTEGLYTVWTNHVREASKRHQVSVLLNREHWGFDDASSRLEPGAPVERLPYDMPSTLLDRIAPLGGGAGFLRPARSALGRTMNVFASPLIILHLAARLRRRRPDAVISHNGGWPAGQLCRWVIAAALLARVPRRIIVIHSHPRRDPRRWLAPLRFLQNRAMELCATSIVAVSDSVKAALERTEFRRPVVRVHDGLPLEPEPAAERDLDWHPARPAVGFVGALNAQKGVHVLLEAFRLVAAPCELALLGPDDGRAYREELARLAGLCSNPVRFLGRRRDVDAFMQAIDVLAVPAIGAESFGLVVLEAMRRGKPVVCSDFGGMKEIVAGGETGLVVPAGDAAALAEALERLLRDPGLRARMGEAGRRRMRDAFTSEIMAERYDEILGANSRRAEAAAP